MCNSLSQTQLTSIWVPELNFGLSQIADLMHFRFFLPTRQVAAQLLALGLVYELCFINMLGGRLELSSPAAWDGRHCIPS